MAIAAAEIKAYVSQTVNDTSSNGGRINDTSVKTDNVSNNLFPDLSSSDLAAGKTEWRKLFFRVEDSEDGSLANSSLYLAAPSTGATELYLVEGSQTDTQGSMATSAHYGVGTLDANVSAGDSSIDVLVKDGTVTQFYNGGVIKITDGTNTEYLTLTGAPSVAGDVVTLTVGSGLPLNAYTSGSGTKISALIDYGTIETSISGVVETSSAGTFTEANVTVGNTGSLYQVWTLTFSSSSAFSVSGDTVGSVGTGNVSSTFAPTNAATGTPYFSIPSSAWSGTWAAAETVQFTTNPAVMAVWVKRITPAGSSSATGQTADIRGKGESSA